MPGQRQSSAWSAHDAAVLSTVRIVRTLLAGDHEALPITDADFPTQLAEVERLLVAGGVDVLTFRPTGDGTYAHHRPAVVIADRGLAATTFVAAAKAAGNRARRQQAVVDSQPRWVVDARGAIWISTAGFYLRTPTGLYPWGWDAVRAACLIGPAAVRVDGAGAASAVSWVLRTDWAELLLLLWTMHRHPSHPQLRDGSWVPAGWLARAGALGYLDHAG